ncbi:MAG: 6-hydroxymethylpterin diphosphokinase MptE-like protein [bacterium]
MNTSIFDENLAAITQRHPQAARELLAATTVSPGPFDRIESREGEVSNERLIIVLGLGSGEELNRLWRQWEQTVELLVIFECDINRAKAILSRVPLHHILNDKRIHFFVGLPPEELRRTLSPLRYFLGTSQPTILQPADSALLSAFRTALDDELLLIRQNADLIVYEKGRMLFNILRNLPAIAGAIQVQELHGRCKGEPAFVVAAGPSLDKNISHLVEAHRHGWVIAADTTLTPLRQAGVNPQMLVTFDPTPLNERHFAGWPDLGETILAFHPEAHAEIPRTYLGKARLLVLHDGENQLLRSLGLSPKPAECLVRGAMTGHLAFNLAVYLGCDPIVLVGMDLAFSPVGGSTHTSAAALGRVVRAHEGARATIGPISGLAEEMETELVELPGIDGGTVYGPPIYQTYLKLMEQEISRHNRLVIDATEGGTRKARTQAMSLAQAIQVVESLEKPVCPRQVSQRAISPTQIETMLGVLSQGRRRLAELKEWTAEPHGIMEWRTRLLKAPNDWLLPAVEHLIYKAHELPTATDPAHSQDCLAELAKELNRTCDCFDLFIQGASQELSNLGALHPEK